MNQQRIDGLPLVWPATLARAPRPSIVYLDQNHFINLAKCAHGRSEFEHYQSLLSAVLRASADGRVLFPLSTVHIMETERTGNERQRRDVANLMEVISGFKTMLGRPHIARLEIEAAVLVRLGLPQIGRKVPIVGEGVLYAFGEQGRFGIRNGQGEDVTAALREQVGPERFDREIAAGVLKLNRSVLGGPEAEDLEDLRARGYAPETTRGATTSRLAFETEFAELLQRPDQGATRSNLRDAVSVREIVHEWNEALFEQLQSVGSSVAEVMPDRESARSFSESMPSTRVAISIKTRYHGNPQRPWSTNDIFDIDALSVAAAYCDAVFTDKQVWNALKSGPELRTLDTFLPRTPDELADWIDRCP